MVEIKTDKFTVRIMDGEKFKADCIEFPVEAVKRFAREILKDHPGYFDKKE